MHFGSQFKTRCAFNQNANSVKKIKIINLLKINSSVNQERINQTIIRTVYKQGS